MYRSRREFLRASIALATGSAALSCSAENPASKKSADAARKPGRSIVVRAHRPKVRIGRDRFDPAVLDEMLSACLMRLTGASDPKSAWRKFFAPSDRVALKVNTLGGRGLSTNPAVVEAIVRGLVSIGIPERNILAWDRFNRELIRAGFRINRSGKGYLCYGTERGYESSITIHGKIGGSLSPLLTQFPTALINVPILKDHNLAGVAISMKNLYGTIDNPNRYHDNNCDPYIADIADLPVVRRKMRLIICDALYGQYEAGPAYNPRYRWNADMLMVATDPVALDTIGWRMIEEKRREAGLKPLAEVGRPPKWLATAASRGLGQNDPAKIEVIDV